MKLIGKVIITGQIRTLSGLHIGGSKSSYEIGGLDLNVVKSANGHPYIPGSSLKGKLRAMLGKKEGSLDVKSDSPNILEMFGAFSAKGQTPYPTRLFVRDALLNTEKFRETYPDPQMAMAFSDIKFENKIDRARGIAEDTGLRQLERVPENCYFDFEIVYNLHEDIKEKNRLQDHLDSLLLAMQLLQDDYLGGQGSRGYGKIAFDAINVVVKTIDPSSSKYGEGKPTAQAAALDQWVENLKKISVQ